MLTFKNSELEQVLLHISSYDKESQKLVGGLLSENLTLGTKRKLQKVHKPTHKLFEEFVADFKTVQEGCKTGENEKGEPIYDQEKLKKELQLLLDEEVKVDTEPIQLSQIENISTEKNYNFDIIEKFAI